MRRRRWPVALALAAAAAAAAVIAATAAPASIVVRDAGCLAAFPERLTPSPGGNLYARALAGLVVCSNAAGTATMVTNSTQAVWTVDEPHGVVVHPLPTTALNLSFLRLIRAPVPAVPTGASVIVPRPPSTLRLRIDASLTIAQLTHDQFAVSLAAQSPILLGDRALSKSPVSRKALERCVRAVLDRLSPADTLLAAGDPAPAIVETAADVAAGGGGCSEAWVQAKASAGVPPGQITSLAGDVSRWRTDSGFAVRSVSASVAYWALTEPANEPPGSATGGPARAG